MERAADPATASPVADTYLNDLKGFEDYIEGRASEIVGIRVIDDLTLQLTIEAPVAYFLAKMTYPTAFVLDRETVEGRGQRLVGRRSRWHGTVQDPRIPDRRTADPGAQRGLLP